MYIMRGDTPVLQFDLDKVEYKVLEPDFMPIQIRGAIKDIDMSLAKKDDSDIASMIRISNVNRSAIIEYLSSRMLNLDRENAKKKY